MPSSNWSFIQYIAMIQSVMYLLLALPVYIKKNPWLTYACVFFLFQKGKMSANTVLAQLELSFFEGLEDLPLHIRSAKKSSAIPSWCQCLKCLPATAYEDQLCCRYQNGECITNSEMFRKLVLQRRALERILQYNNPLLNKNSIAKKQLAECARNQYVQWRFGSNKDTVDFAKIPSCCRHEIEHLFNDDTCETSMQSASGPSCKPLLS